MHVFGHKVKTLRELVPVEIAGAVAVELLKGYAREFLRFELIHLNKCQANTYKSISVMSRNSSYEI